MANTRRVDFLRYFNDYRMLAMFPIDTVVGSIILFLFCYTVLSIGGASLILIVGISLVVTTSVLWAYVKAKKTTSKGLLRHWLFSKGIYRLKQDEKRWEELQYSDFKNYLPAGKDNFFAD